MTIFDKIKELDDSEIDGFINERLEEIDDKEERVIGYNSKYTMYNGFIGSNVRVNFGFTLLEDKSTISFVFSGMEFNDKRMYVTLIEEIKKEDNLYLAIINAVDKYLSLNDIARDFNIEDYKKLNENLVNYMSGKNESLSIRLFRKNKNATCTQIAGVAQNMFQFLGIESDYALESNNENLHAYNLFYPWGRESEAVIYDGMRSCTSRPYMFLLDKERKEELFTNKSVEVNSEDTYNAYRKLIGYDVSVNNSFKMIYSLTADPYILESAPDLLPTSTKHKLIFRKIKED